MLEKPKHGWSKIKIGLWSERCSYLDDVPIMLLKNLIVSCCEHRPVAVKFDAEGWEYILVIDWQNTYVIDNNNDEKPFISLEVNRDDIAASLIDDIRRNIDEWVDWTPGEIGEMESEKRKIDLLKLCDDLEYVIPSDDYRIVYSAK